MNAPPTPTDCHPWVFERGIPTESPHPLFLPRPPVDFVPRFLYNLPHGGSQLRIGGRQLRSSRRVQARLPDGGEIDRRCTAVARAERTGQRARGLGVPPRNRSRLSCPRRRR